MKIMVAITGASGSIYGRRLIERLCRQETVERVWVCFTSNGGKVFAMEQPGVDISALPKVEVLDIDDMFVPPASGSASADALAVAPCSAGMMSRIACGVSDDLVSRAADVMLKERRKLIIALRETPLNLIHLHNMEILVRAGAVVMPASPSFYSIPETIEQLVDTVVDRIMAQLGFHVGKGWQE